MRISLLHATYRAGPAAVAVRDAWLKAAADPSGVEHIFACDADDEVSMAVPEIAASVVGPPMNGVSAVRNWNAAARRSTGDLLFAIADDLEPPIGWDQVVAMVVGDRDPLTEAFVVKGRDTPDDDSLLLRHPLMSRAYFKRYGLWCEEYQGHFVDNDLTLSAQRRHALIDAREGLVLAHRHWLHDSATSESHTRMQTSHDLGLAVFEKRWPEWKQIVARHGWIRLAKVKARRALRMT